MSPSKASASPHAAQSSGETLPRKRKPGTQLWQRIVLGALVGATGMVRRLSRPAAMRFGIGLGRLGYRVARRQRRISDRNLRLAYGEEFTAAERDALTRRVFEQFGKTVVDFLRTAPLGDGELLSLVSDVEGWEWMESTRAQGKGFIIITGHIGNFEFLGNWLAAKGIPSTAVARDPDNAALAAYVRGMRERRGNTILSKGASARELLGRLKRGEVITLGIDQNSGDVFVPFFGVPAGTVDGPARLALHTGALLLPCFCVREPGDLYRIIVLPPIRPEATGDRETDVARIMAELSAVVESVVRRYPDQWLWLHNRWKSAFFEENRARWSPQFDFEAAHRRWRAEETAATQTLFR